MKKVIMLMAIVGLFVGSALLPQESGAHYAEGFGQAFSCRNDGYGHTYNDPKHCDGTIQVGWHMEEMYQWHIGTIPGGWPDIGQVRTHYIEMDLTNGYCINLVFKWKARYLGPDPAYGGNQPLWEGVNGNPKTQFSYTVQDWHSPSCYGGGGDPD